MANTQVIRAGSSSGSSGSWPATPSGSQPSGVLGDTSDSTYMSENRQGFTLTADLDNFTLPDGALLSDIRYYIRSSSSTIGSWRDGLLTTKNASGAAVSQTYQVGSGGSAPANTWVTKALSTGLPLVSSNDPATAQTVVNAAQLTLVFPANGTTTWRSQVSDVWAEVIYATPPKISGLALSPSDAGTRTTRPKLTWTNPPGGIADEPMTGWELAIWPLATITGWSGGRAGFEASGAAFTQNGFAYKTTSSASESEHVPTVDLANSTSYVAYIRAYGQFLGSTIRTTLHNSSVDFSIAIAPPADPTSVSHGAENPARRQKTINVGYSNQAALAGLTTRRVEIERRRVGTSTWWPVPKSPFTIPWGTAGTLAGTDDLWVPGAQYEYRARITGTGSDGQRSSAWVQAVVGSQTHAVLPVWTIRHVTDRTGNFADAVTMGVDGDLAIRNEQRQGVFQPLGSRHAIVVSDARVGPDSIDLTVRVDKTNLDRLMALREVPASLQLVGDMTGWWRWVKLLGAMEISYPRSAVRTDDAKRIHYVRLSMVEVRAPLGLPEPDEA